METEKKKYNVSIGKKYPARHSKKGQLTHFREKMLSGEKKHTIRTNSGKKTDEEWFANWEKRIEKVNKGLSIIQPFEWVGQPYAKGSTIDPFNAIEGKVNYQKIELVESEPYQIFKIDGKVRQDISWKTVANNDGLKKEDFVEWFKDFKPNKSIGIIIHFTDFKY